LPPATRFVRLAAVTPPQHPISGPRVALTVIASTVIGSILGVCVAVNAPKTNPATAVILNPAYSTHSPGLTRLRAELTASDLGLANRWGTTLEQAANKVADCVELKSAPGGLKVSAILPSYGDARGIARTVATDLGTPQHEAALAAKWKKVSDITPGEAKDLGDLTQIEYLLHDQARGEGFESYAIVLKEAAEGNEKAAALTRTEDFSRRLSGQQELTKKLGFDLPPGTSILSSANPVEMGEIEVIVPPYAKLAVPVGRFGGMALGGLLVLALLRWKPGFLRPAPRVPAPAPAWASTRSASPESNDEPW
jgi:hypothetical protein